MRLAVEEARKGLGFTTPNPAVGCVLVKNGRLLASGYHRRAGSAHAEIEALSAAGGGARGATAYVSLEPCSHQGRTPPCADALIEAGITRVVVGCKDPNPLVAGRGVRRLRARGLEVKSGVLRDSCTDVIRGFRKVAESGLPYVHLKLAASLDGRIAARGGDSKWISSRQSRATVQLLRARSEAVMVGIGTVKADDPRLNCRLRGRARPLPVVLDRKLRTPLSARVLTAGRSPLIVCAPRHSVVARRRLQEAGATVLPLDMRGRRGWLRLLAELARRDVLELLIEGGARVASSALKAGVVDRATFYFSPRLIGGDGIPMVESLGVRTPADALRLSTETWSESGGDLVWTGEFS